MKGNKMIAAVTGGLFLLSSCEKTFISELKDINQEIIIEANFSNPNGNDPVLSFDQSTSDSKLFRNLDLTPSITFPSNRINLTFNNIRFTDDLGVYEITGVSTEENIGGEWNTDLENTISIKYDSRIDMCLVLDLSSSLGSDKSKVIQSSVNMITAIKSNHPDSRFSIVAFSQEYETLAPTENIDTIEAFVNAIQSENATKLYESINVGIDILDTSNAKSKILFVFTDGRNNSWSDPTLFENTNLIKDKLSNSSITSFLVGLNDKGGVEQNKLSNLAFHQGHYETAENITEYEKLMNKITDYSNLLYLITYDNNNSASSNSILKRFTINTSLK